MHEGMDFCRYFFLRRKIVLKHDLRLLFLFLEVPTIYTANCIY